MVSLWLSITSFLTQAVLVRIIFRSTFLYKICHWRFVWVWDAITAIVAKRKFPLSSSVTNNALLICRSEMARFVRFISWPHYQYPFDWELGGNKSKCGHLGEDTTLFSLPRIELLFRKHIAPRLLTKRQVKTFVTFFNILRSSIYSQLTENCYFK
jgi:hypothetical protein